MPHSIHAPLPHAPRLAAVSARPLAVSHLTDCESTWKSVGIDPIGARQELAQHEIAQLLLGIGAADLTELHCLADTHHGLGLAVNIQLAEIAGGFVLQRERLLQVELELLDLS